MSNLNIQINHNNKELETIKEEVTKKLEFNGFEGAFTYCEEKNADLRIQALYYRALVQSCLKREWTDEVMSLPERIDNRQMKALIYLQLGEINECRQLGFSIRSPKEQGDYFCFVGRESRRLGMPWENYLLFWADAKKAYNKIKVKKLDEDIDYLERMLFDELIPMILSSGAEIVRFREEVLTKLVEHMEFYNHIEEPRVGIVLKQIESLKSAFEFLNDDDSVALCEQNALSYAIEDIVVSPEIVIDYFIDLIHGSIDSNMCHYYFLQIAEAMKKVVNAKDNLTCSLKLQKVLNEVDTCVLSLQAKSNILDELLQAYLCNGNVVIPNQELSLEQCNAQMKAIAEMENAEDMKEELSELMTSAMLSRMDEASKKELIIDMLRFMEVRYPELVEENHVT